MSFTLTAWPQPADQPMPTTVMQAQGQLDTLWNTPGTAPEPRFLALARALAARFPDTEDGEGNMYDHGLALMESSPDNDRAYNIGLWARDDKFEVTFNHLVVQANDLGLHVMDGQNGVVYLAHGDVLTLGPHSAASLTCRLDDAVVCKDWRAAWQECRRLAPQRLSEALTIWALMVSQGRQAPPHPILGAALAKLSGTDPHKDKRVAWCLGKVLPSQWPQESQLLEGLRKATDLVAFVDAELQRAPTSPGAVAGAVVGSPPSPAAPDAATAEAAKALGIDPELVARAEAGSAKAQCKLALKFMEAPGKPTAAINKLILLWLERAAAQNQSLAQALLGDGLLSGRHDFPADKERGLALLEASAAADDVDGLNYLAQYLYRKSVRLRPGKDTVEKLTDPTSRGYQTRVPQLLMRAAAQGSARGLFYLAVRLWDEIGTPRDDVAAKAVMQLARTRAAKYCVEQPEVLALMDATPSDSKAVMALAQEFARDIKQLPALLNARFAARPFTPPTGKLVATQESALSISERHAATAQPGNKDEEEDEDEHGADEAPRLSLHMGHLALGLGMIGALAWLMMLTSMGKGSGKPIAIALGLVSAFGVWRCTADLDWGAAKRGLFSALALLPGVGFIVSVAVMLQLVRNRP